MSHFVVWSSTAFYFPHTSGALLQFSIVLMLSQRHRQSETACRIMRKKWKSPPNTHIHTLHVMVMLPAGAVLHQHTTQSQIVFLLICWHFYNRTLLRFDLIVDLCWTYRDRYTARYQKQLNIMSIFQFFFNWPAPGDWGWFYTGAKKKKQQEKTLFLFSCFH